MGETISTGDDDAGRMSSDPTLRSASAASDAAASDADVQALLGLLAYTELTTFTRLAESSRRAPGTRERRELARRAGNAVTRQEWVLERVAELGGDPDAALEAFDGTYSDYDARTRPRGWWERLLKGYVGHGVVDDFCRLAVDGLDDRSREVVLEVIEDGRTDERSAAVLADAAGRDPVLASRLALWGRRLVGEALGVAQGLLVSRPGLARLVADGAARRGGSGADAASPQEHQSWVLGQLTAEHTRRMARLGLTA
ncbi:ferritin-like fold-containing protein [Cellulomonas sp. PhB143]|uniref:ferritin-like fold-containing protein n=1 Tax=Cellulomonas sp. PhB143 TaxID=2485186 RepID=UPI000F9C70B4|nr:ferritin-like fold-containing protein [Cellulomonas sp. PhB143]ROS76855.1 tRNA-(MS[2]IO[6]A)-hydroxylase MiaE-like protein [Cellulomonas sp. PhB143]